MSVLIEPQERRTSEVPYHSDLAPGRRFVFVGRQIYPQSALYVVGRRVDNVPRGQPEWLEDHRHNCHTFYVFIGDRGDLSGLRSIVTVERQTFEAHAPVAVLLPKYALHHYRLAEGSGWSFHINLRGDYEESLAELGEVDTSDIPAPIVEEICRAAQRLGGPGGVQKWSFIDSHFERSGIRLTVRQIVTGQPMYNRSESHCLTGDGASLFIGAPGEVLEVEVGSGEEHVRGISPATVYHSEGTSYAYTHIQGAGLILELEKA